MVGTLQSKTRIFSAWKSFSSIVLGIITVLYPLQVASARGLNSITNNNSTIQSPSGLFQSGCFDPVTVTTNTATGPGSIGQAIIDVCSGGTITFDGDHHILINSPLQITKALTIDGDGQAVVLDGQFVTQILNIQNAIVTINDLQFTNGLQQGNASGAVFNNGGNVTINDSFFTNNGSVSGNGFGMGGAIINYGMMAINNVLFANNHIQLPEWSARGGVIFNMGTMTISSSTFLNNGIIANSVWFGLGGAIYNYSGALTIADSHFQGNYARAQEPGDSNPFGGAIYNNGGATLSVNRSTFYANVSEFMGGAIHNLGTESITNSTFIMNSANKGSGGAITSFGSSSINNSTITNNYSYYDGGGISLMGGNLILRNSILASSIPLGPSSISDCIIQSGADMSGSHHNLIKDGSCYPTVAGEPIFSADLVDAGGLTKTIALLPGSPAIDAGDTATCESTDQRGVARPQGSGCDLGAFESQGFALSINGGNSQSTQIGTAFANPLKAAVSANSAGEPVDGGFVTFAAPMSGASVTPTSATAIISAGIASQGITANSISGSYNVSASAQGVTNQVNFGLTNLDIADLSVTLTDGITTAGPGLAIYYTLIASNQGPATVVGATLVDTFPAVLTNISYSTIGSGGASGFSATGTGNINETNLIMPPGSTIIYDISAKLSTSASGMLSNTAVISVPDGLIDPNEANNSATDTDTIGEAADLQISIGGSATAPPGAPLVYLIDITNNGPSAALNVEITDFYPPGTTFASFTQLSGPAFTATGTPYLSATIASLPANATAQFELVLNQPVGDYTGYTNVISTDSSIYDPIPGNNYDQHPIIVSESPAVTIEQAPTQVDPTNTLPLRFTATFSNAIVASSFVSDDLTFITTAPGTLTATITELDPFNKTVFEISLTGLTGPGQVQLSLAAGKVQNTAGLPNLASTSTDNVVFYDQTSPLVTDFGLDSLIIGNGPKSFEIVFSKDVNDPAGNDDPDDVTNPANYLIVSPGLNGTYQTTSCDAGLMGDDGQVAIQSVNYSALDHRATVLLNSNLPTGRYRLFVCGSTSIVDLIGNVLNNGVDMQFNFEVQPEPATLPSTGFPMGKSSDLLEQPRMKAYTDTIVKLEIPNLQMSTTVVGVPVSDEGWDVTWLREQAGWLTGSAYPTWEGNTVLTGHVWGADNNPGIFWGIKDLKYGDEIYLRVGASTYVYQVQSTQLVNPRAVDSVMKHEQEDWLTLITCEKFDPETKSYPYRRMVRAVFVEMR